MYRAVGEFQRLVYTQLDSATAVENAAGEGATPKEEGVPAGSQA